MCGIIGLAGVCDFKRVFAGLKALEYRGYDSFGFGGLLDDGRSVVIKKVGAISDANRKDFEVLNKSEMVIGHTRWATHGGVSDFNSHPHEDTEDTLMIVHNGVISNFSSLRKKNPQWRLSTETDTEIAANIIADSIAKSGGDITKGLMLSCELLEGEFAICGIVKDKGNKIFALKRKSSLIVAKKEAGLLISSDRTALSEFADSIELTHLDDDTVVYFNGQTIDSYRFDNGCWVDNRLKFNREDIASSKSDLGSFPHYMIKEITESSCSVTNVIASLMPVAKDIIDELVSSDISMTGSGSAYYVAMIGQYFFKDLANKYVSTHPSDEYLNVRPLGRKDTIIAVSQSGETFDTLEILRKAKEKGSCLVAINNVENCSMQLIADFPVYQNSGKEVCVLSTKSIVSQVAALYMLASKLGNRTGRLSSEALSSNISDLKALPNVINSICNDYGCEIEKIAYDNSSIEHWFFIGRGAHYPVALESALKFKEVSYLHAEGMPAGFFKHGTISLIDENFYTVVFLPSALNDPELFQLTIDNIYEIKARKGRVIGFGHHIHQQLKGELFDSYVELPDINPHLNIIIQLVAGQLFAYHCAVSLGRNIDRPRALAKSVTVR